jgi:hypothetical protein
MAVGLAGATGLIGGAVFARLARRRKACASAGGRAVTCRPTSHDQSRSPVST